MHYPTCRSGVRVSQEVRHIDQTNNETPMYNFHDPTNPWDSTLVDIRQWFSDGYTPGV